MNLPCFCSYFSTINLRVLLSSFNFGTIKNVSLTFLEIFVGINSLINKKAEVQGKSVDEVALQMKKSVPMNRFGNSNEVANAVVFLSSIKASYINGINLPVDGGRTASL